jgi:hypothetical protein
MQTHIQEPTVLQFNLTDPQRKHKKTKNMVADMILLLQPLIKCCRLSTALTT